MDKLEQGFLSVSSSLGQVEGFFVENEVPEEGAVLEMVLVKKEVKDKNCSLVVKLRVVQQ
ncbi:hypothetical protein [Enterobacter hormaechei]|uniref:hypothetical protein n=1 Tax=Enterobacter hormaechei TaxID=158836 RepID=UPI0033155212